MKEKKLKEKKSKKTLKELIKIAWSYIKRPPFFIGFIVTWILLESPMFFGVIIYLITKEPRWWGLAIGWYALTAPPLPIPVIPLSIAAGTAVERLYQKAKEKKENGQGEN